MNSDLIKTRCEEALKGILAHPAMLAMLLHGWLVSSLISTDVCDISKVGFPILLPAFALLALFIDKLTYSDDNKVRWSWALVPLYLLSCYWDVLDDFEASVAFVVIHTAVLPLCYLWVARKKEDISFIRQAASSGSSLALAGIFTGVLSGVTALTFLSVNYLFDVDEDLMFQILAWFELFYTIVLLWPLFISFEESGKTDGHVKVIEAVFNWVVSPALVVYTLILYAYIAKILFTWTLPDGGVAMMVFAFSIVLFICKSYQRIQDRKPFAWFYKYSWVIAIPLFILFWIGTCRRLMDYGCTTDRYYLVICGIIMTILSIKWNQKDTTKFFHYFCIVLSVVFIASIACPGINHRAISIASQKHIVSVNAEKLGILDDNGKLIDQAYECNDSTDNVLHRKVYQSLKAMNSLDETSTMRHFGVVDERSYYDRLPRNAQNYVTSSGTSY